MYSRHSIGKTNWISILKALGLLAVIEGIFMLLCLPFCFSGNDSSARPILLSAIITVCSGIIFSFPGKIRSMHLRIKDAYIIVSLAWIIIALFGTLPYLISGSIPAFSNAFFESISGFTTTGASILRDIEAMPKGILFWRSMTHWVGGVGIIVLFTAVMPLLGSSSMQLFSIETSAVSIEKIHPHIKGTALRLSMVYLFLTLLQTGFLLMGHMSLFDALCHSFATVATGGFSTKNTSMADFSPYIQYVTSVFMILAGVSFTLHYYFLKGDYKKVFHNEEFTFYHLVIFISVIIITIVLFFSSEKFIPLEKAFRDSLFQVVSIITCTGFVSADYEIWPSLGWFFIFLLMFCGGMAGSTAGGIKTYRHLLMLKVSRTELYRRLHPNAIIPVKFNDKNVSESIIFNVQAFFIFYVMTFLLGTIGMILLGLDVKSAAGGVASCLGGIGPGLGIVGAVSNYADVSDAGKYLLSAIMLLGRLELFTFLVIFTKSFWRK